jgi:PKD repeat protein
MINPKPVADFFFPAINCMGAPIQFTDMSYIPSGFSGYITTWAWDFGDGTPTLVVNFPGNPSVTHTYSGAATAFVVRLTVTTTSGCSAYKEKVVTTTPSPVANFMAVGATCVSKPVQFTDMSQTNGGGVIVAFNWNFGDPVSGVANTSTAQNPVHIFTGLGVYYVSQTVTNINGCTNTIIKSIQVYPRPYSNFMADTVHVGSPTTFTDLSSSNAGPIINWLWEFGDGQTSLLTNPSYVYPTSGTYMAKLTVTSIYGCNKDTIKPVVVLPAVVTPPVTQTITNVIVGNAQTRCYDATQDITVAGNGTLFYVLAGGNATFIAGQTISYLPGTTIQPDGYMRGYIAPTGPYCPTANMPAVTSNGDEHTQDPGSSLFRIYPNPTRDNFTLELKGELRDNIVTVEIYDTWGIMVLRKTFAGENRFECSLVGLPAGLYFVRVVSGNQIEITKMIKE